MDFHLSDMLILEQLYNGPKKPYGIIKGIINKFSMDYKPSTGMIYPSLKRLLYNKYIKKDINGYSITGEGKKYFDENYNEYNKMVLNFIDNKIFFKNLRKAIKNLFDVIHNADKNYIGNNQVKIINKINKIAEEIKNGD